LSAGGRASVLGEVDRIGYRQPDDVVFPGQPGNDCREILGRKT
jgi:hypothetical protein